jgi:hypothetical protein
VRFLRCSLTAVFPFSRVTETHTTSSLSLSLSLSHTHTTQPAPSCLTHTHHHQGGRVTRSFDEVVMQFFADAGVSDQQRPRAACFAVAGPVDANRVAFTNRCAPLSSSLPVLRRSQEGRREGSLEPRADLNLSSRAATGTRKITACLNVHRVSQVRLGGGRKRDGGGAGHGGGAPDQRLCGERLRAAHAGRSDRDGDHSGACECEQHASMLVYTVVYGWEMSSRGCFATPRPIPQTRPRTEGYTCAAKACASCLVQGALSLSRPVPNPNSSDSQPTRHWTPPPAAVQEVPHRTTRSGAPIACVGAGTGLGQTFMTAGADGVYEAWPTEGGHAEFAPRTELEIELLRFLKVRS